MQVNWMRYLSGMAHREEFKYAAEVADSLMTLIYLLLGIVACERGTREAPQRRLGGRVPWCLQGDAQCALRGC